jgi:hypothetical protein
MHLSVEKETKHDLGDYLRLLQTNIRSNVPKVNSSSRMKAVPLFGFIRLVL